MTIDRTAAFAAALLAASVLAGCGREEPPAVAPAPPAAPSAEEKARDAAIERSNNERKRLMTKYVEAQKSGDAAAVEAVAKEILENRKRAAETARSQDNPESIKEKAK